MSSSTTANGLWGRASSATVTATISVLGMLLLCPIIVIAFFLVNTQFSGSFTAATAAFTSSTDLLGDLLNILPVWSTKVFLWYVCWVVVQALLFAYLPGPHAKGNATPAGFVLDYNVNGLRAYILSIAVFVLGGGVFHWWKLSIIYDHWGSLLISANLAGFGMAIFAFLKAHWFPTHPTDRKFSGNLAYDFFMGIELNPRVGVLDLKLFCNGRPGIIAWTLINLSFAAAQYERLDGHVTGSMVVVNILQLFYVADFFGNESWYLRTIDICHDHFGFYLAWGDFAWLPFMYTLQGCFLVINPVDLGVATNLAILCVGLVGYWLFRSANAQKDTFRLSHGQALVWGKLPKFIATSYTTADGSTHKSTILCSGFWGIARHFNYIGDLILSLAYSLPCGFDYVLPHFYFWYMVTLLAHRTHRDDQRCKAKYGADWDKYCSQVPWKMLPGIY